MLRNNSEGMFTDFLDDMASNYTPEQLNQAMGRTDITSENVASYKAKLQAKSATIKELRKVYDRVNNEVINPVRQSDIDRLDASDPEQRKEKLDLMIYKKAWDNLKDELLFNHGKIANKAQRMIELEKQLKKETDLAPTEIQALISKESLSKEIKILETQVEANKNLNLKGRDAKDAKVAEQKFEALKKYQTALAAIEKAESASKTNINDIDAAYSDLFEAYHEFRTIDEEYGNFYGTMEPEEVKRAISRKSFDAIVDYLDLKAESQALQSVVNTLVDTRSASMWVERNAEMMANLDKNKETHIANQLKAFHQQASSSEMLTELQEAGLFFDLNEIDDLVEKGIMPSQIYNIETNKPASKEEYQKAQDLISSFYKNLTGKSITQNKAVQSKTSLRYESDKRMVEDLMTQYGIELDKEMDLSDPAQLTKLIKKLKASKYLTYIDKEILDVVSDSTPKIKFTTSGEFPIEISEDGVITIDLRYAGHDYKNASVNFETLILSALTQAKLTDNLENNKALKTEVDVLMNQAKEAFAKKYPNTDVEKISMLNNTAEFLSESLNNASFQKFLGGINDTVSGTKKSLWTSLMAKIMKAFGQTFDKSVLQRAVSLANMALDENVVDSIDEKNDATETTETEEEPEPVSSVEKHGYKLMEVVPGVWQVTGKGEVKAFDTKEEAEAYFNEKAVPPTKTVKQTVKEKVTRTVTLGNTDFIKNAFERPDIFGEFLHPEVVSKNKQLVDDWTQKIVALGTELDAAGITDWNYGNVRVDIDGRLVIDVTAEVNGKQVKFLMYKSTGTGSTALSLGEWVPLIAIGTHPDGKEWFVKAYHEGQDPKFNKYGSQTFASIDQDLKNKEKELFKGKKSTQEIEEEVEREIDVEVPADTEETPEEVNQRILDEENELKNEINSRRELLKRINEQISSTSKMNLRKRIKLGNQKKDILLEIKSLQEKLDFTYGASSVISPAGSTETPGQVPVQNEPEYDLNDNVIITQNTPFLLLPYKLQEDLLEQHRMDVGATAVGAIRFKYKDLIKELESLNMAMSQAQDDELDALDEKFGEVYDKLTSQVGPNVNINLNEQGKIEVSTVKKDTDATADEIGAIESKMANDISYMRTIIEYNKSLESNEPDTTVDTTYPQDTPVLTTEEELERAKRIKQEVIDKAKETVRARRLARQKSFVPITVDERESVVDLLKKTFKDDFDILTKSELDYLVDSMLSDSKSFQFKIPDAIAFLNKKKLDLEARSQFDFINEQFSEELSKLRAEERAEAIKGYQKDIFEEMVDNRFDYNYDFIESGVKSKKIFSVTYNGKTHKFTLSPKEFRALALYNNDIFKKADSKENLLIQIHTVLRNVKYYANSYKKELKFEGTPQEVEDQLIEMYFMLGKKGVLLPSVVRAINYALYNAKVKLTIVESNALTGQAYSIEARESVAKKEQPKTKLAVSKEILSNFVHESGSISSELWQEALIAEWFFNPEHRLHPDFVTNDIARGKSEKIAYKSFLSNKSDVTTASELADQAGQDFQDRLQNADISLVEAVSRLFGEYTTISDMVNGIAERIAGQQEDLDADFNQQLEDEKKYKEFLASALAEEENDRQKEYMNSLEYKIETGNLDTENLDYNSLTEYQKFLYDRAVEAGWYPSKENPSEKKPEQKPIDLFEEGLNEMAAKQTSIDKEEIAVRTELREIKDSFDKQKALLAKISDINNDANLKMFIAIYKIINDEPALNVFNEQQRNILNDRLSKRLKQGAFIGQSVSLNDKIFQIVSYDVNNQTVEIADIKTGEMEIIPFTDFANIKDVHEVGQEITNSKLNTEVKDQEIEIIKDAYKDIFSNFTANVSEYETIEDADLKSKIIEQLTKCK